MLRIRTKIGDLSSVFTLLFNSKWITITNFNGKTSSNTADNLQDAGVNHLVSCQNIILLIRKRNG